MKKFVSKKNNVFLNENSEEIIIKEFTDSERQQRELGIYEIINGKLFTPKILKCSQNIVEIEYIHGDTMLDMLMDAEPKNIDIKEAFIKLFNWLKRFKEITGKRFFDINLRNFIYCEGEICGIDFEDASEGSYLEDFGKVLAYILTYGPEFTDYKFNLVKNLLLDVESKLEVFKYMEEELHLLEQQRRFKLPEKCVEFISDMRGDMNED